ncbi:hypothetical protein ACTXT7_017572 [Hymenolepis weldensis]
MVGGHVREEPTGAPTVVHAQSGHQQINANADADVCVETLQTIVVKSPWIDYSVANEGRPSYVFQQDTVLSHKALKTQDWMAESCHLHVTPNLGAFT